MRGSKIIFTRVCHQSGSLNRKKALCSNKNTCLKYVYIGRKMTTNIQLSVTQMNPDRWRRSLHECLKHHSLHTHWWYKHIPSQRHTHHWAAKQANGTLPSISTSSFPLSLSLFPLLGCSSFFPCEHGCLLRVMNAPSLAHCLGLDTLKLPQAVEKEERGT